MRKKLIVSAGLPTGMEGLTYPIPFSDPETVLAIALHAEKLGYHSVWGNDHMTTQNYVRAEFPVPPRFWEPLVTYAFLAARTTTLRFGTGVLVTPMRRDIVPMAKQICTLDHFSGGRVEIGVGVGAYREEFLALNPDSKAHRGDMVAESVAAMRALFDNRVASFEGKYYRFRDVEFTPKPLQKKMMIYYGGNSRAHLPRVARDGDGWLPAALTVDRVREDVPELRRLTEAQGRDPDAIEVAPQFVVHVARTRDQAVERFRRSQMAKHLESLRKSTLKEQGAATSEDINLIGTPQEIVDKAHALREAGVTHLLGLYFAVNEPAELLDQMEMFAKEVMPHIT
jgi:probable F420-dependent oxidoreductase